MRLAAICAVLIILAPERPAGQEQARPYSIPWVAHAEYGGFSLVRAPEDSPGRDGYQIKASHGLTVQPWSLLLVHAALRYRESMAPGFSQPYREPFAWLGTATVEVLPEFFFIWLGVNWPMGGSTAPLADSSAWDALLSRHAALPDPSLVNPATIQAGAAMRLPTDLAVFFTSLAYQLPADFSGLEGARFRPAWILRLSFKAERPWGQGRQSLDIKGHLHGPEQTWEGHEAHRESPLLQLRYSLLDLGPEGRVAAYAGVSGKMADASREVMLDIPPVTQSENDNLQRLHLEGAYVLKSAPWRFRLAVSDRVEMLWRPSDGTLYLENTLGLRLLRRVFSGHGMEMGVRVLSGQVEGKPYYGGGVSALFTFRHLGADGEEGPAASP